MQITVTAHKL